jgi:hypothetical protein
MDEQSIISAIDAEIAKLEQVRAVLVNGGNGAPVAARKAAKKASAPQPMKRTMSSAARKRIAAAQRKRWAKTKRLAALSAVGKKSKKAAKKGAASGVPF